MNLPRVVADWEERLSGFLQDAIDQPHREPEICEELIEYVQHLVRESRRSMRLQVAKVLLAHAKEESNAEANQF